MRRVVSWGYYMVLMESKTLVWIVRGMGKGKKRRKIKLIIKKYDPPITFLSETGKNRKHFN